MCVQQCKGKKKTIEPGKKKTATRTVLVPFSVRVVQNFPQEKRSQPPHCLCGKVKTKPNTEKIHSVFFCKPSEGDFWPPFFSVTCCSGAQEGHMVMTFKFTTKRSRKRGRKTPSSEQCTEWRKEGNTFVYFSPSQMLTFRRFQTVQTPPFDV